MKYLVSLAVILSYLMACSPGQPVSALEQDPLPQQTTQPPGAQSTPPKPKIMVELTHEETGEKKWVEGEVEVIPGEKFLMRPIRPELDVNFDRVHLSDENSQRVKVDLDRVTLVEYWSADALEANKFWSQTRELERKYEDADKLQIVSINYDTVLSGKDQIEAAKETMQRFSPPKTLFFDFLDSFRDALPVPGPVSYYLIDHRRQMTHFGRGDIAATQKLFDAIENALIFQDADRQKGQVQLQPLEETPSND